jgi:DNA gyrase subunit A
MSDGPNPPEEPNTNGPPAPRTGGETSTVPPGQSTPVRSDAPATDGEGQVIAARVEPVVIEDEMRASYLDYAMSVIVGRALPDVRDGLKPVHRRIIYSMDESGLRPDRPYRKCASAVGEVMKKYHPHGDSAIYDALVRMGQDFSIRNLLVDGHGNFGSVDGDPPAAMRYTEARLSRLAMELIRDIAEETVDFVDNYDGYEQEPTVLPARFPNLLANGATGIAVGMATNIPPHNLGELIDATIAFIDDPSMTVLDLMEHVPAPDFPTGGIILGRQGSYDAYTTGRGSVKVRAVCTIEGEEEAGGGRIVVTEIPYMVNKSTLLQKIAQLVTNREIEGIRDLRDESSSRGGIRVVIELKRDAQAQVVLNRLYKHTQLQDTFGVNLLALVDGVPRTLTLDQALRHYIDHQVEVITRRTRYRLRKAQERAHVLEGLLVALDHLDEVIQLIRNSPSADDAKNGLIERYELSEIQAQAILDMQLRRLAALERQRLQDEYRELQTRIADLQDILGDPSRIRQIIKDELTEIRGRFSDERRSRIVDDVGDVAVEDLIKEEEVCVTLTRAGYVKRTPVSAYRSQKRGGRGVAGADLREDDIVRDLIVTSTHDWLLFFTNAGRVHRIKGYQVPERSRSARGVYVANVHGLELDQDERVAAVIPLSDFDEERYLVFATKQGTVKRTALAEYDSPRSTLIALNLAEGDQLIGVTVTSGDDDIVLVSRYAQAIRFHEDDARPMGRTATGVRGMRLRDGDEVLWLAKAEEEGFLLVVTDEGYGKRTPLESYPAQKRGGMGVLTAKLTDERGQLAGALVAPYDAEILLVTDVGTIIRIPLADVRATGRNTQGVRLVRPDQGAKVASVALVLDEDPGDDDADLQDESTTPQPTAAPPEA